MIPPLASKRWRKEKQSNIASDQFNPIQSMQGCNHTIEGTNEWTTSREDLFSNRVSSIELLELVWIVTVSMLMKHTSILLENASVLVSCVWEWSPEAVVLLMQPTNKLWIDFPKMMMMPHHCHLDLLSLKMKDQVLNAHEEVLMCLRKTSMTDVFFSVDFDWMMESHLSLSMHGKVTVMKHLVYVLVAQESMTMTRMVQKAEWLHRCNEDHNEMEQSKQWKKGHN
jgi:hypothetical protein